MEKDFTVRDKSIRINEVWLNKIKSDALKNNRLPAMQLEEILKKHYRPEYLKDNEIHQR